MNKELLIENAKKFVFEYLGNEPTGHDYFHALRVYNMALYLSVGKDIDDLIIGLSALLHDLDDEKINVGKNLTDKFFAKYEVDKSIQTKVKEIINKMSFRKHLQGERVLSLEGKIVQDADRLDALGAIGIARCFSYNGHINHMIYKNNINDDSAIAHFYQKLFLLPDLMNLEESKVIALERVAFMKDFVNKFYQEWN